jgi:hypothetical protein
LIRGGCYVVAAVEPGQEGFEEPTVTNLRPFPGNYKKAIRTGRGHGSKVRP